MPERLMPGATRSTPSAPSFSSRSTAGDGATVLAFDYGEKRVGVAVGDARLRTSHPLAPIAAQGEARMDAIARLIVEWRPARLVIGLPVAEGPAPHPLAGRVRQFARGLEERFALAVAWVDERYSSAEAEARLREAGGRRRAASAARAREIDSYAAQLLLEQHFAETGR